MIQSIITDDNFQIKIGKFNIYKCSSCGGNDIKTNYKYCPHCGVYLLFDVSEDCEIEFIEEFIDECEI